MKNIFTSLFVLLALVACDNEGGSRSHSLNNTPPNTKAGLSDWQASFLGQEGHGGDAVVCFSIPVSKALSKVEDKKNESDCPSSEPCIHHTESQNSPVLTTQDGASTNIRRSGSGVTWTMTAEGRRSIQSAKPLEQYVGEKIASKKNLFEQLKQLSVEEGYQKLLKPFTKLPAPFHRISEIHQKLGWLHEDGISSEYGLIDVNDSGFIAESDIDNNYCKELQAVVRRGNQLWYDADIVKNFDNAGRVLIQLHEEIYAWGKDQDQITVRYIGRPQHDTSIKTRRLILKILDEDIEINLVNENLKNLGFSTLFWVNQFKTPTSVGYFMDKGTCLTEQKIVEAQLNNYLSTKPSHFWFEVKSFFIERYLKYSEDSSVTELNNNLPPALSKMISLTLAGDSITYKTEIFQLLEEFKQPESCEGHF